MNPKLELILILYSVLVAGLIHAQKMEDFTYSDILQLQSQKKQDKIYIFPQSSILNHYEFPQACQIDKLLDPTQSKSSQLPQMSNIDGEIEFLKSRTSEFLRLSDKIELLVRNLKDLPNLKHNEYLHVSQQQLNVIQQQQTKLRDINSQIDQKGIQLENIVNQMMKQQQNPLFKQAALNFQKKALQQKITLFNNLLTQTKAKQQQVVQSANQQHLNTYFSTLQRIFNTQNNLIQTVDTLLKNHNELAIIKAKVTSLSSQLKAYDLTLVQKQQCNNEFIRIKQKQKHDKQVIKLIDILKQKKLQYNQPNKYCEGVVEKLIQRIRKLLAGYDYIWNCKQGLEEIRQKRAQIAKQLENAQRKLDELQMSKGVQAFRQQFQHNRALVQSKINQLNGLKLDDYYRNPTLLQNIIGLSQQRIQQIETQLTYLPIKSNQDVVALQNIIKEKIQDIKRLKTTYCQQNEDYVINSRIIEDKLYQFERQEEHNSWVSNLQQQKLKEIDAAKARMAHLQDEIEKLLQTGQF